MSANSEVLENPMHSVSSKELGSSMNETAPQLNSKTTNIPQPTTNGTKVKRDASTNGKAHANSTKAKSRGNEENIKANNDAKDTNHNDIQLRPHVSTKLYHRTDRSKKKMGNGKLVSGRYADSQWEQSRYIPARVGCTSGYKSF